MQTFRDGDSDQSLRLGLVGFGRLARHYYVPALRALGSVEVAGVVDPLMKSLQAARASFPGVLTTSDPEALLGRQLDGLIVASPPSTHLALWRMAARQCIPVLMEKPFVLRGELDAADISAQKRRLLMLDLNRRFWPPYRRIRELLQGGRLGDLLSLEISLHVDVEPWCSVTAHRLEPHEGGVLFDLGSQAIDLARWITGLEPREVLASAESRRWNQDQVRIRLRFVGGSEAVCNLAYTKQGCERVVVTGRRAEAHLRNPNMGIRVRDSGKTGHSLLSGGRDIVLLGYRGLRRSRSMMRYSVAAALAAFVQSIREGLPFSPGFEDAVANAKCLDAASVALDRTASVNTPVAWNREQRHA